MTESINQEGQVTAEQDVTQEPDFFDSVASDIVKAEESITTDDNLEDDEQEEDAGESDPKKSQADLSQKPKRQEGNRANDRIRLAVERAQVAEGKYQAAKERLDFANERISALEGTLTQYEQVIKEFETFREQFINGDVGQPAKSDSTKLDSDKPLTAADIDRLFEEREAKKRQSEQQQVEQSQKLKELKELESMWMPHIKRIKEDKFPVEQREFLKTFIGGLEKNPKRTQYEQLIKVVGKYQHAPEILYGLFRKKGFESQNLAEQIEDVIKLNGKIAEQKSKLTQSKPIETEASATEKPKARASSYEEYLRKKYQKK